MIIENNKSKYLITRGLDNFVLLNRGLDNFITKSYADLTDYSKRFINTKGDQLGILLSSGTLVPIQASGTGVDIITSTGGQYKAYLSNTKILSGTGPVLWELYGRLDATAGIYPGCDTPNIKLPNGQVWAACNVGATTAGNGPNLDTTCTTGCPEDPYSNVRNTLGSYFQWGRNDDVTHGIQVPGPYNGPITNGFIGNINFYTGATSQFDWIYEPNNNLWGGSGTTYTGGTYSTVGAENQILMKGPCNNGYHIPTIYEWWQTVVNINPNLIVTGGFQTDYNIAPILKLPLAGKRNKEGLFLSNPNYGGAGYYWASSSSGTTGTNITIYGNNTFNPYGNQSRINSINIRCLKN